MNKKQIQCEYCEHCLPIGEGDHICDKEEPIIIIEEYAPNENYGWCWRKENE